MNFMFTRTQHVLLSYTLLGGVSLSVAFLLVAPAVEKRMAFVDRIASLRTDYTRSAIALGKSEALRSQIKKEQSHDDSPRDLFRAETPALAGADLQNQLRTLIETKHGTLMSSAFRQPATSAAAVTPLSVSVRLRCSVESLLQILYGLENRQPALFVDQLVIQSRRLPGRPLQGAADELDVELEVTGYLDGPASP